MDMQRDRDDGDYESGDQDWAHRAWHRHPGPGGHRFGPGPRFGSGPRFRGGEEYVGDDEPGVGPGGGFFGGPPGFWPGPGGPHGPGPRARGRGRRGGRARRGDVRAAVLALVAEEPTNGYQIIQRIAERSGGIWQPSPGAIYPALSQLEDEGLILAETARGGRRAYVLTEAGRTYVADNQDELRAPWSAMAEQGSVTAVGLRKLVHQVHLAAVQVLSAGSDAQVGQAREILVQARRGLYRILAEDDDSGGQEGQAPPVGPRAPDPGEADA